MRIDTGWEREFWRELFGLVCWLWAVVWIIGMQTALAQNRVQTASERVLPTLERRAKAVHSEVGAPLFIRIFKQEAILEIWIASAKQSQPYTLFASYPICAYSGVLGPKTKEGDLQAPEGYYEVRARQMNPASRFHLSFNLGYPNAFERAQGFTGSALMVHGNCVSIGCFAMTDAKIEEIYVLMHRYFARQPKGMVPVLALPFRPSVSTMELYSQHPAAALWKQLQALNTAFEAKQQPPAVRTHASGYESLD